MTHYDCTEGCPALVDRLKSIVGDHGEEVILEPYPNMGSRIGLTAWQRIGRFIRAYRGVDHHVGGG